MNWNCAGVKMHENAQLNWGYTVVKICEMLVSKGCSASSDGSPDVSLQPSFAFNL